MHIANKKELDETIIELEKRLIAQEQHLKNNFEVTRESLKPATLMKRAAAKVINSPGTRTKIFKVVGAVAAAFLAKKIIAKKKKKKERERQREWEKQQNYKKPESSSFAGNIAKNLVRAVLTKTVMNNADKVKAYGTAIFNNVFKSNHKQHQ